MCSYVSLYAGQNLNSREHHKPYSLDFLNGPHAVDHGCVRENKNLKKDRVLDEGGSSKATKPWREICSQFVAKRERLSGLLKRRNNARR